MFRQSPGFVVAMRGVVEPSGHAHWSEWLIVARWGVMGEFLSISRTRVAASGGVAPIGLTPKQTAFSRLLGLPPRQGEMTFLLSRRAPRNATLAGDFLRAEGYLRLPADAATLNGEGQCGDRRTARAWRLAAVRASWTGELIDDLAEQTS